VRWTSTFNSFSPDTRKAFDEGSPLYQFNFQLILA